MRQLPDLPVRVLTVRQPWAWAIIHADPPKDVENRAWTPTAPSLLLLIHAGQTAELDAYAEMRALGVEPPPTSHLVTGCIIGAVTAAGFRKDSTSKWADPGDWHWELENPVPIERPIPARGMPGLFHPPAGWQDRIRANV